MALPRKVALCLVVSSGMVPQYWLVGWEEGVMWLAPCKIAADLCLRRLLHRDCGILLAGERLTGLSLGRLLGVFCPRRAIHSSAKGTVMRFSAVRLSTSLLTSFREKLVNLSAIRPETTTAITCSDPLPVLNMVCAGAVLLGEKKSAVLELKVPEMEGYSSILFDEIFRGKYPSSQNLHCS